MSARVCPFEERILRALRLGSVDADARAHAASCPECAELLEVAGLVTSARRAELAAAKPPAAGAVWFRIRMRARRESARRSSRAAMVIQALSLLAAALAALALVGVPRLVEAFSGIARITPSWGGPLLYAMAAVALLAPVALAFALARR